MLFFFALVPKFREDTTKHFSLQHKKFHISNAEFTFFVSSRHPNQFGLPDNQRIIDPKRGPVKKVAAVRKLPKLDSTESGGSKSPGNSPRNS